MSRIGKLPITVPDGTSVVCDNLKVSVSGPKGSLVKYFKGKISIGLDGNKVLVKSLDDTKDSNAMMGTARSIINNMIVGATQGFSQELEINGVGYRVLIKDEYLNLSLGKSHNTKIYIPKEILLFSSKPNSLIVKSHDKERLGEFVAVLMKQRPPEPYKGKGINIKGRYFQRKEGKKG